MRTIEPGEEFTSMLRIHEIWWWIIILRFIEFIETILFVLRKKENQITFLHIYHHISTVFAFWLFLKYSGCKFIAESIIFFKCIINFLGMDEILIGIINTAVHIVMYSYYLLTSIELTKKLVRPIKPLITAMQLGQFFVIMVHCIIHVLPSCNASKLFFIKIPNISLLIFMFGKFFVNSYLKENNK